MQYIPCEFLWKNKGTSLQKARVRFTSPGILRYNERRPIVCIRLQSVSVLTGKAVGYSTISSGFNAVACDARHLFNIMKPDDLLCYCFHVTKRKVMNYLRVHKPRRPSQLSECGGAGTGCGWCVPYLNKCFKQHEQANQAEEIDISASEYASARASYIEKKNTSISDHTTE